MRVAITQLFCWPKGSLNESCPRFIERSEHNPFRKVTGLFFYLDVKSIRSNSRTERAWLCIGKRVKDKAAKGKIPHITVKLNNSSSINPFRKVTGLCFLT